MGGASQPDLVTRRISDLMAAADSRPESVPISLSPGAHPFQERSEELDPENRTSGRKSWMRMMRFTEILG
jgi:hypothetical protein